MANQPHQQLADSSGEIVKERFFNFLKGYHENHPSSSVSSVSSGLLVNYPEQIANMIKNDKATVFVDYIHLNQADPELAEAILLEFYRFESFLRKSIQEFVRIEHQEYVHDAEKGLREFFVSIYNLPNVDSIREIHTDRIGRLVAITGTVTRSSDVRPELILGTFSCAKCGAIHELVEQQCQYTLPPICRNSQCSSRDFQLLPDQSTFVDWQTLRVQENADEIPAGSMPRCIDVICRNEIVESAKAGDKIVFTGTVLVVPDTSGLSRSVLLVPETACDEILELGLKKLGVKEMTYRMIFVACAVQHADNLKNGGDSGLISQMNPTSADQDLSTHAPVELTESEKIEILRMRNSPKLYSKMAESICPSVFGHPEVKRGILLMLFGGVHKTTPEGISLRGDINVCIIGDPSTAKSQFLKYVHSFLSRAIYTSGKASSAAGLTASVVKDSETGEFCIEAGALMLADNAICCIDEFDKMDPSDQVAIHEAMEQQTISITKAGIQATLNARTSILAAANPVYGRYDRSKTLKANVAVSAPIMSRFDLFFIILDECNPKVDESISRHIIEVHRSGGVERASQAAPFSTEQLRRYIQFARTLDPIINEEGRKTLVECYRLLRQNDLLGKNKTAYRITVRQLESLIRLSEALARLHLDEIVRPVYIREAYRLLQQSIIFVESEDIELDDENLNEMEQVPEDGPVPSSPVTTQPGTSIAPVQEDLNQQGVAEPSLQREISLQSVERQVSDEEDHGDGDGGDGDGGRGRSRGEVGEEEEQQPPLKKLRKEKKSKGKTLLSAELYRSMTAMIGLILKARQEQALDAAEANGKSGYYEGCRWGDLLTAYLTQCQNEMNDSESFDQQRKLVNQVIRRMIKHEETLIEISPSDDCPVEDRLLILSPSFDI